MRYGRFYFVTLCVCTSCSASALTGSGASSVTPLETVSPTLESATAVTDTSVSATFSEAMLAPGVADEGNYFVSGLGTGTLSVAPDFVSGGPTSVSLDWTSGEMRDGVSLMLMVSGVQDAVGNPLRPDGNSASFMGKGTAPVFGNLSVTPSQASAGGMVTITFTVSEPLADHPEVTVNGQAATHVGGKVLDYNFTYEVQESDTPGMTTISVSGADLAGNLGTLSDSDVLEILETIAGLPLFGWPWVAALLLALGLLYTTHGRRALECGSRASAFSFTGLGRSGFRCSRPFSSPSEQESQRIRWAWAVQKVDAASSHVCGAVRMRRLLWLVLAATFACSLAFAQAPSVTNVTLTQSPTATSTQVDIYYDLDAPNGPCDITVTLSKDRGDDGYPYPVTSVTGDLTGVTTGTNNHIVWDIREDYPEEDLPLARVLVTADDGVPQYTLTYLAGAGGTIDGQPSQVQTVNHSDSGTLVTAVGDGGYVFGQWSDGSNQNPRQDTNVTEDITVTASFVDVPPVVTSFVINNDDASTVNRAVTLNNTATESPTEYLASESSDFSGASWQAYDTVPTFTLHGGTAITRTVYFKARNGLGESEVVSDTIYLAPDVVSVPAGTFTMGRRDDGDDDSYGSDVELPRHDVTLSAYQLGKYQVTNQQYCDVLNWAIDSARSYLLTSTGAVWTGTGDIYAGDSGARCRIAFITSLDCNIEYTGGMFMPKTRMGLPGSTTYSMAEHPMVRVSWYGSVAFANWLSQMLGMTPCYDMATALWPLTVAPPTPGGYRLPTEAEWERAAAWESAGGGKHWIYGGMSDTLTGNARCNYWGPVEPVNPLGLTVYPYTSPVGWFNGVNVSPNGSVATVDSPSPVGAYDMSGNVWEWCHDWYSGTYYDDGGPPWNDPTGPGSGTHRVLRGGYWGITSNSCRSARRYNQTADNAYYGDGFRIARTT